MAAESIPELRRDAGELIGAALEAANPEMLVREALDVKGNQLRVLLPRENVNTARHSGSPRATAYAADLSGFDNVFVIAMGKAGATMALGAERALGGRLTRGVAVVKEGYGAPGLAKTQVIEAAHPVPDQRNPEAARSMLELAGKAGKGDLVVCLISGGGSALVSLPAEGITLDDLRKVTDLLLKSGAGIGEINAVRNHLTRGSGGRLAQAAAPAEVLSLIISDVIGDHLHVIASGPTVPDETTYGDALEVIRRYGLEESFPAAAIRRLREGAAGRIAETPKAEGARGEDLFQRVTNIILASNAGAMEAAARRAADLGYEVARTGPLAGEARERAVELINLARKEAAGRPSAEDLLPICVIAGGETTVTVTGNGRGGRAQEFALAAAIAMEGMSGALAFAFGTDGTDGPTDAAGAFADGGTVARAHSMGLGARAYLSDNNSYPFFSELGDLIITGPTGTNVNDIYCVLIGNMGHRPGRSFPLPLSG